MNYIKSLIFFVALIGITYFFILKHGVNTKYGIEIFLTFILYVLIPLLIMTVVCFKNRKKRT